MKIFFVFIIYFYQRGGVEVVAIHFLT